MMRKINRIIIHYTDSPDVPASTINGWHAVRFPNARDPITGLYIGYHKVIRRGGAVEPGRDEATIGAHCKGFNSESLGVVLTGSDREDWYPAGDQYSSLQAVLRDWMRRYRIPASRIYFHREKYPTSCPGRLDKKKILDLLGAPGREALSPAKERSRGNIADKPIMPTLRRGSRGKAVGLAQQRLHVHHARPGAIDGVFGPLTHKATIAFQKARGIKVDGVIGPVTWSLLLQPAGR